MSIAAMMMHITQWNGRDILKYMKGSAVDFPDLIAQIIKWTTDKSIHGDGAWEVMRNEPWPRGTIIKAHGRMSGELFYIGLLPNAIEKGKTYSDWFMKKENLASYFVWNPAGLNKNGKDFSLGNNGVSVDGQSYSFTEPPDLFTASAQTLHLGVFKQYSEALDWHEQAGGMDFSNLSMRPLQYSVGNSKVDFNPPLFPGSGHPTLTMDYSGSTIGSFDFWLIKDAQRLIIVMNNAERWDSAFLGLFEAYDNQEYALPAAVVGGTSGFVSTGANVWYSPGQVTPTPVIGLKIDYRPDNWSLTHGIAPFVAVGEDRIHCPSAVMAMLPDGQWQGFANYVQGVEAIAEHVCNGPVPRFHFLRNEPVRPKKLNHYIRPTELDVINFTHVYEAKETSVKYQLEPLELLQADGERTNILGRLPNLYFPSFPVKRYGEVTIDGKLCLMIPNSWEGRKFHIEGHAGIVYDEDIDQLLFKEQRIEKLSKVMNLLIRLEE